jgi:hypothetical protein
LQFDYLAGIEIGRRTNLHADLIAILGKPDRRFPGHTSHLSSMKVAEIAIETGTSADSMTAESLPHYVIF